VSRADHPVTAEVKALAGLNLQALRAAWTSRGFGPPPALRSPELLRHMLAYRLQAAVFGDLDAETRRSLRRRTSALKLAEASVGSKIAREYLGEVHEVEVVPGGYRYAGEVHASLSTIARKITGTRWNGPRFFGLREAKPAGKAAA
jgi:hypothetical protein